MSAFDTSRDYLNRKLEEIDALLADLKDSGGTAVEHGDLAGALSMSVEIARLEGERKGLTTARTQLVMVERRVSEHYLTSEQFDAIHTQLSHLLDRAQANHLLDRAVNEGLVSDAAVRIANVLRHRDPSDQDPTS